VTHFVGGPRAADATYFSFKNDQLDRYFFEIEGGVAMTFADSTTALIGARSSATSFTTTIQASGTKHIALVCRC
jgi:hypothetical protein